MYRAVFSRKPASNTESPRSGASSLELWKEPAVIEPHIAFCRCRCRVSFCVVWFQSGCADDESFSKSHEHGKDQF